MAGILNDKQRIMDVIITTEGRRQVAAGELQIKFATFTDRSAFYLEEADGIASGADDRIYFEATNRPQDQIIFETDDSGNLMPFTGGDLEIAGDKILAPVLPTTGSLGKRLAVLTGSQITEQINNLLANSADNFANQYILGTKDTFSETSSFEATPGAMTFTITDKVPFSKSDITQASINNVESLYQDMRLSHLQNYRYLPPVNRKSPGGMLGTPLGSYKQLNQAEVLTYDELLESLENNESIELLFSDTSMDNNIVAQMMEVMPDKVEKLAMIDFGEFPDEDPYSPGKRVFFLGKIFNDDLGNKTYVNLFTIIFD